MGAAQVGVLACDMEGNASLTARYLCPSSLFPQPSSLEIAKGGMYREGPPAQELRLVILGLEASVVVLQ